MAYLIGQLFIWLVLVAALAGVAGWAFHAQRTDADFRMLERERDHLRGEFLSIAGGAHRSDEDLREMETLRTRDQIAASRVTELERLLAEARDRHQETIGRIADMERALEEAQAKAGEAPVALLPAPAPVDDALNALTWRLRYAEARTRYLENAAREATPVAANDTAAADILRSERDEARAEAEKLRRAAASAPAPAPAALIDAEETAALKWRSRYLESRVRFLETQARESAPGALSEAEQRLGWRARYNTARAALFTAPAPAIAEPAPTPAATGDSDTTRLRWRARYLDARVQRLEARLAAADATPAAAADVVEPAAAEPAPLVPVGAEVKPPALAAPRNGAPDDLTLIDGVGQKTEAALHALGVHHFDQIADWSDANIAWVDQYLRFRGRIVRERWVEQAQALARGAQPARKHYFEVEIA